MPDQEETPEQQRAQFITENPANPTAIRLVLFYQPESGVIFTRLPSGEFVEIAKDHHSATS